MATNAAIALFLQLHSGFFHEWYRLPLQHLAYGLADTDLRSSSGSNEVSRFYEASLARTDHDATYARLNTQRKILIAMWAIWCDNEAYNPELFYPSTPTAAAVCQAA